MSIQAILFDKDGTLFTFGGTWTRWMNDTIDHFSNGDETIAQNVARHVEFDRATKEFLPHSEVIAGTAEDAARALHRGLPHLNFSDLYDFVIRSSAQAPLEPATDLTALLNDLAQRGLKLGVMTNDSEYVARENLKAVNITEYFDFIAGYDSGHGMKPSPDPLLAFAKAMHIDPAHVAMVGDSTHDLRAARAAGMISIAVLTGPALAGDLQQWADVILHDIGHIPSYLDGIDL